MIEPCPKCGYQPPGPKTAEFHKTKICIEKRIRAEIFVERELARLIRAQERDRKALRWQGLYDISLDEPLHFENGDYATLADFLGDDGVIYK